LWQFKGKTGPKCLNCGDFSTCGAKFTIFETLGAKNAIKPKKSLD